MEGLLTVVAENKDRAWRENTGRNHRQQQRKEQHMLVLGGRELGEAPGGNKGWGPPLPLLSLPLLVRFLEFLLLPCLFLYSLHDQ